MMRRRLFTIGETEVYLHLASVLYGVYMLLVRQGSMLMVSLISILIHEAAHGLVSACFGKPPQEIEITPLGAVMRLEDEASLPSIRRMLVLLAGPLVSLLMCWGALHMTSAGWLSAECGRILFATNLLFFLGNLLPALPMDGGRILMMLLSMRLRSEIVRKTMRVIGTCIGLGLIVLNLLLTIQVGGWNFSLAMTGCFLMYAAAASTTTEALKELRLFMDRKNHLESKGIITCKLLAVTPRTKVCKAVKRLMPGTYTLFVCVEPMNSSIMNLAGEGDVIEVFLQDSNADFNAVRVRGNMMCNRLSN